MKTWILEPRDPVIVRDGRPFSAAPGARAATLPFPFPSTIVGATRTRAGRGANGIFDQTKIADVKKLAARGPLLVQLDAVGNITEWFVSAPADMLLLEADAGIDQIVIRQLKPIELGKGLASRPYGWMLVGMSATSGHRKPHARAPRFWRWTQSKKWLISPQDQTLTLRELGLTGLMQDSRTHVKVEPGSQTAEDGALFQTRGLEFSYLETNERLGQARRLALAVISDADVRDGVDFLGGEQRMSAWREATVASGQENLLLSGCPKEVLSTIQANEWHCRLVLLTPAFFNKGAQPSWLVESPKDVAVEIKAAAMNRYQVVSGWDLEQGHPKPTRRLTPAGTVFFLKLTGEKEKITTWANYLWMKCMSDEETDRRDGFGLAVMGNWDGNVEELKYVEKSTN
jgi:CRISPR-associated protein Cmr3